MISQEELSNEGLTGNHSHGSDSWLEANRKLILKTVSVLLGVLIAILLIVLFVMVLSGGLFREDCSSSFRSLHCFGHLSAKYSVVLISMDGFRHDYLDLFHKRFPNKTLPNFARVEAKGIRAEFVRSVYPTTTLPTHHTMVTGLYPQHHGAVADQFIDSVHPFKEFSIRRQRSLDNDPWLDEWPEPLWITVQKAGGLVGSHLWPLTDRPAKGDTPFQSVTELALLNNPDGSFTTYPYTKRIHDILWWLRNPHYHLDLILSYFNEPAATGYHSGPESDNVLKTVQRLDELLGQLLDGIHERNLEGKVDLILTSGNGMASFKQIIALDNYVEKSWYEYTQMGASAFLYPNKGKEDEIYQVLRLAHPHLKVYRRAEMPTDLYYSHENSRMPPLILIPDSGFIVKPSAQHPIRKSVMGYPPYEQTMAPFFMAIGPSFRAGAKAEAVNLTDIYSLLCGLLRIRPKPSNGSFEYISKLLKENVVEDITSRRSWSGWIGRCILRTYVAWMVVGITIGLGLTCIASMAVIYNNKYGRATTELPYANERPELSRDVPTKDVSQLHKWLN